MDGYRLFKKDMLGKTGGVFLYVREKMRMQEAVPRTREEAR